MGTLSDRIKDEIDTLTLQTKILEDRYKASKAAIEDRIANLKQLKPHVTPNIERLLEALGIKI